MQQRSWSLALLTMTALLTLERPAYGAIPLTTIRVASGLTQPAFVTHAPGDLGRDDNFCTRPDTCTNGVCTPGGCASGQACTICGGTCVDNGGSCDCEF